jgi:hypothetical protein
MSRKTNPSRWATPAGNSGPERTGLPSPPPWLTPALTLLLALLTMAGVITTAMPAAVYLLLTRLPVVAAWWAGAMGLGWLLRRWLLPEMNRGGAVVQAGLGAAAMLWVAWVLSFAGGLNRVTAWAMVLAGLMVLFVRAAKVLRAPGYEPRLPHLPWPIVLAGPALGLLLVCCCCPPSTLWSVEAYGYDVLSYHLQLPREWFALGRMQGLDHNVYSFLPSLMEVGYLQLGHMTGSVYGAIYTSQLLHASFAIVAAWSIGTAVALRGGSVARARSGHSPTPLPLGRGGVRGESLKAGVRESSEGAARTHAPHPHPNPLPERERGCEPGTRADTIAGAVAGAIFLAVPWTLITGSMAYNEMAVMAFAGVALVLLLTGPLTWRTALLTGLLLGAATMTKLTAGTMLALPLGAVWFARLLAASDEPTRWARRASVLVIIGAGGAITLSPYFIRNASQTGNPVFPMAAHTLGHGHWGDFEVNRWNRGHAASGPMSQRFAALAQHWIANAGYGALGGAARQRQPGHIEAQNVARFGNERGMPTLWLAVFLLGLLALTHAPHRRLAAAMFALLALQIVVWLLTTHLQSRFLLFTLLPGLVLLGLGVDRLDQLMRDRSGIVVPLVTAALAALLSAQSFAILLDQTILRVPVRELIDLLPEESRLATLKPGDAVVGDHTINQLPETSRTYLVADASRLLFIRRPFVYDSAFDVSLLGQIIREQHSDPAAVSAALRQRGITHLWIHGPELARLHATYGYDSAVTFEDLVRLTAGWRVVQSYEGGIVLLEVPPAR